MKREIAAALGAFAVCWSIGSAGCSFGDDCDCPSTPEPLEAQAPHAAEFGSYDRTGNAAPTPFEPANATIEIKSQSAVVRYEAGGVSFEVTYDVTGYKL